MGGSAVSYRDATYNSGGWRLDFGGDFSRFYLGDGFALRHAVALLLQPANNAAFFLAYAPVWESELSGHICRVLVSIEHTLDFFRVVGLGKRQLQEDPGLVWAEVVRGDPSGFTMAAGADDAAGPCPSGGEHY